LIFLQKGRFRILKSGIRVKSKKTIINIVKTCAALHNQLLFIDGLNEGWESGVDESDWLGELGQFQESDLIEVFGRSAPVRLSADMDVPKPSQKKSVANATVTVTHTQLQDALIDHFKQCSDRKLVMWPRRDGAINVEAAPVGERIQKLIEELFD
jgi:hypothetical protein